ncbi:hypothetical protein [Nonomuraea sp. KM90]|uniref:hypothetical protein n=1 Tax=Nonomuraea sp. KM90 TaxID=3457428 RepID=UPI003FCE88A8
MPLPQILLDDPRVLALAKARQQFAHDCAFLPTWDELTDKECESSRSSSRIVQCLTNSSMSIGGVSWRPSINGAGQVGSANLIGSHPRRDARVRC